MSGEKAFLKANFDWVVRLDSVWSEPFADVSDIHGVLRDEITEELNEMDAGRNPLGRIVLGPACAGKTHLLCCLRRRALKRGAAFVLVDMTDVHDFFENALLGYLTSLMQPNLDGVPQYVSLLRWLVEELGAPETGEAYLAGVAKITVSSLKSLMPQIVREMNHKFKGETLQHHDVIIALFLLNSRDTETQNMAFTWLQGQAIDEAARDLYGFRAAKQPPGKIISGLSWLLSLRGPTLLALDQLDAVVSQQHLLAEAEKISGTDESQRVAHSIITGIAGGLSGMRDITRRTLILVSCLEPTIDALKRFAQDSFLDRYRQPDELPPWAAWNAPRR